jgi:hypothetical protein
VDRVIVNLLECHQAKLIEFPNLFASLPPKANYNTHQVDLSDTRVLSPELSLLSSLGANACATDGDH